MFVYKFGSKVSNFLCIYFLQLFSTGIIIKYIKITFTEHFVFICINFRVAFHKLGYNK